MRASLAAVALFPAYVLGERRISLEIVSIYPWMIPPLSNNLNHRSFLLRVLVRRFVYGVGGFYLTNSLQGLQHFVRPYSSQIFPGSRLDYSQKTETQLIGKQSSEFH